jgi:hypothetical protein
MCSPLLGGPNFRRGLVAAKDVARLCGDGLSADGRQRRGTAIGHGRTTHDTRRLVMTHGTV